MGAGRGHRPPGRGPRLPLPLAVRPPLPRPVPLRRPPRPVPRPRPPARPRRPGPGHAAHPAGHAHPLRPPPPGHHHRQAAGHHRRPLRRTAHRRPGRGVERGRVPAWRACPSAARANACATWRRRSSSSGGCSAAGPSPSTAATSRRSDAMCLPRPVQQPSPPIWVGGSGDRLLDLVARVADGWNTAWIWTPDAYRERLGVLHAACDRAGRDPSTVTLSVGQYSLVGEDAADLARRFEALQATTPGGLGGASLDRVAPGPAGGDGRRGPGPVGRVGRPRRVDPGGQPEADAVLRPGARRPRDSGPGL